MIVCWFCTNRGIVEISDMVPIKSEKADGVVYEVYGNEKSIECPVCKNRPKGKMP